MVAERSKRECLAETEFLFGLRKGDRHHSAVTKILDACISGLVDIQILSSAVVEVKAVLYSRGLKPHEVEETCSLMDAQLVEAGITGYVATTLSDAIVSERLREQHPDLTFFDALHLAIARRLDKPLLSNDLVIKEAEPRSIMFQELIDKLSIPR